MKTTALRHSGLTFLCAGVLALSALPAAAQPVDQGRGVDSRVDYASLTRFGPWDDRNYQLVQEDLALLAPNEHELTEGIPAFYRVHLRKTFPGMLQEGPVQYPRSALPRFRNRYGGFLVDGRIYTDAERQDGRWIVVTSEGGATAEETVTRSLAGEARVTNPNGAAESAIAINPVNPDIVIAGSNGPGGGQRMHFSTDGGETWTQAANLPLGGTCCDPTVDWSSDGTKGYTATLGSAVFFYRSGDGGQTWDDLTNEPGNDPRRELGGGVDKEYIHVDRFATSPHLDNIYLTWHQGTVMQFARSTDLGHTWTSQNFSADPRGIGSDIVTDKGGKVYYFWPTFTSDEILVKRSTDGGVSFENGVVTVGSTEGSFDFPIPSMSVRNVFIYNSAAVDYSSGPFGDSVYVAWTDTTGPESGNPADNHARIQVAYSRDGGDTWTVTTPHETADANDVDRWHQWLSVGPDGKVYVMFYDTRNDPTRDSVDVFYSISEDGAQTWDVPQRLTTVSSPDINDGFEFGDYNGMDVVMNRLITIFTDNRSEAEGGGDSVDVYAAGLEVEGSSGAIFADGFESGNTSAWTATVP